MDKRNEGSIDNSLPMPPGADRKEQQTERLLRQILEGSVAAEKLYPEILQHCRRQQISEKQLWQMLAAYRADGTLSCSQSLPSEQLAGCQQEKLRLRILTLIGRLPSQSLEDFAGLVAFSSTFAARVQFLCDLLVYLFTEREKGGDGLPTDGRLYTEFFTAKPMWELDVVHRIAEQRPLAELADQCFDWLTDRILDGEVLI